MTTTFQTALTTPNYTSLRGANANNTWAARQFITLCKNTVVFAAQANGSVSANSTAQITFNNVAVGAYTNIEIGETFFLSHVNDIRQAYYRGRIRKVADSTHIYINETSVNITNGDYIFVVYDFDIWDVLSRMVGSTQFEDYDIAYQNLPPVVVGLQTAYINYDPTDGTYQIAFNVGASYATDMYSTSSLSYQFTFVGGTYAVISGALNTSTVTVAFNANTEQWGKLVITDSQGTTWTRRFYIRAHGSTDSPALNFTGAQITGSVDQGWNATASAWSGVSSVLDQTFTVIWSQEYYNGTLGPIYNNIDMVGRFHREEDHGKGDPLYSYIADVKFDIEGIATQMQRLQEQDLTTVNKGTATAWDQISFNTPQRSIVHYLARHSTLLSLCDLTFPNGFDITYLFQYCPNQGGNVLDAVRGLAKQINANIEFAPDGRIQIVRDTRFLSDKSGVVIVGNFDNRDFTAINTLTVDPVNKTGRLDAYGASYNAGVTTAYRSRAPGVAQGYASGQSQLDNQILAATSHQSLAQAELNYRAGQQLGIENLTYSQDWKSTHGGYHFLIPSRGQRVTHLYPTATNVRSRSFGTSDYWQVVSISINHDNATGKREVTVHEELEPPVGDSGDTVPQIITNGAQLAPITLQPLDPFPALPDNPGNYLPDNPTPNPYPGIKPPIDGNTVIYTDGAVADTSRSVVAYPNPVWTGATPSDLGSFVVKNISFDLTTPTAPIGAYLLASDGTNSKIWYTPDVFTSPAVWTAGASFAGVYTRIRSSGTAGGVLAYAPAPGSGAGTVNMTYTYGSGPASANIGDTITLTSQTLSPGADFETQQFTVTFNTCVKVTVLAVNNFFQWHCKSGGSCSPNNAWFYTDCNSVAINGPLYPTTSTPLDIPNHICLTAIGASGGSTNTGGDGTHYTLQVKLEALCNPGGNAQVVYSSNYGVTVGGAVTVGTSPGIDGAFDLERIGGASLAAASGQVMIATSLGGAYSNAAGGTLSSGQPVTLVAPYRRFPHGAVQYSASNPDYLLAGSVQIAAAGVWKVDGASGTKTDITPTAGAVGIGPDLATIWQSSAVCKIAIVVNVSGVYKLYTSLDGGATWTFRRNVTNPVFLRCRRNDPNGTQLYLIDGATLYVSLNWGVSWATRTAPTTSPGADMDIFY